MHAEFIFLREGKEAKLLKVKRKEKQSLVIYMEENNNSKEE